MKQGDRYPGQSIIVPELRAAWREREIFKRRPPWCQPNEAEWAEGAAQVWLESLLRIRAGLRALR